MPKKDPQLISSDFFGNPAIPVGPVALRPQIALGLLLSEFNLVLCVTINRKNCVCQQDSRPSFVANGLYLVITLLNAFCPAISR